MTDKTSKIAQRVGEQLDNLLDISLGLNIYHHLRLLAPRYRQAFSAAGMAGGLGLSDRSLLAGMALVAKRMLLFRLAVAISIALIVPFGFYLSGATAELSIFGLNNIGMPLSSLPI